MTNPISEQQKLAHAKYLERIKNENETKCTSRDLCFLDANFTCVQAIAQAAINVELFTIPLYTNSTK